MMEDKRPKLSGILIEMTNFILRREPELTSDEAALSALLLAQYAWNREADSRRAAALPVYHKIMKHLLDDNPSCLSELHSTDCEALIQRLILWKRQHHPRDRRFITVCGTTPWGTVRVEWDDLATNIANRAKPSTAKSTKPRRASTRSQPKRPTLKRH